MTKSICKLIYGYMAVTYAMLFFGVLISDTLYDGKARILCGTTVPRYFVPGIMNVPPVVIWLLFGMMIAVTAICAIMSTRLLFFLLTIIFKQFTLGIGITNGLLGLYTLIIYGSELKNFFPLSLSMPTVRSAFLVIGSYVIVLLTLIFVPMIIFSKDEDQFDRIW